jgi:DNA-binding SARP family transcriptional activator/tetratricopeptide (TPR) repeat protein
LPTAAAGFGKSTFAREYAATFPARAIVDIAAARDERSLSRLTLAACAAVASEGDRERFDALQYAVAAEQFDAEAALDALGRAWPGASEPVAFIFESAETLLASPAMHAFLGRVLASSPEHCTLIVCSRRPLRLPLSKIAPPHRIVTLRASDLAFGQAEIESALRPLELSARELAEVERVTQGWPIGVLMLRRFAEEGRLREALSRLDDLTFEETHDYLVEEVLGALAEDELDVLLACAAVPDARRDDIAAALGEGAPEALERLLQASPFVQRVDGVHRVHPLLAAAVQPRFARRSSELALRAARSLEAAGGHLRAAQIFRHLGDLEATASNLVAQAALPNRVSNSDYSELIASLDAQTLRAHPLLRAITAYPRRFRVDPHRLRDEIADIWQSLPASLEFEVRSSIGNTLARQMYETGRFDEAEGILRELERLAGGITEVPRTSGEAYIARTLACVLARSGRLDEADAYFRKGYDNAPGAQFVMSRSAIERAIIERMRDRRDAERRLLDEAIVLASGVNATVHVACALAEAAFGAWLAGEDDAVPGYVDRLEDCVVRDGLRGFAQFCAAARGNAIAPNGCEQPNWLACTALIAAAHAQGAERRTFAEAAKAHADESNDVFLRVLANVALALTDPARAELLAEALALAASIEAPAPQVAVAQILAGARNPGILATFAGRFAGGGTAKERLVVQVLTRTIRRGQAAIDLRDRELALVIALARQRGAATRLELGELLWPELDEPAARDALNSCLYRVRQKLGEAAIVWRRSDGYRLEDGALVDVREIDTWAATLRQTRRTLRAGERVLLGELHARLRRNTLREGEVWEWLEPLAAHVEEAGRAIGERLAQDALARAQFDEALTVARDLIERDPCDETARELAIRAHMGAGDRVAAARELRTYRDVLARELDAEPSEHLASLIRGLGESQTENRSAKAM